MAGLEDVRLHDLRHSFASVAVSGGASLPIIGALLGHTNSATTQRYAHLSDDPVKPGFPRWINNLMTCLVDSAIRINAIPTPQRASPASPGG